MKRFYEFFTNLKNCRQIFEYDEFTQINTINIGTTPEIEELLCLICFERKKSVILKCYVLIKLR
jgi:hypothetical protein